MLHKYKNNITSIKIQISHDSYAYLLQESYYLEKLEKMDILLEHCVGKEECESKHLILMIESCNTLISRYANKLQYLGINGMTLWSEDEHEINCREMPSLPNLKSFTLGNIYHKQASYAMRTVNYENITNLKLHSFDLLNLESENLNIRNLSALILDDVYGQVAVALL